MHEHEDQENEGGSMSKRHMLIMVLCCVIPIALLIGISALYPGSPYFSFAIVLLCPLFMLLMHLPRMLPKKKKTEKQDQ